MDIEIEGMTNMYQDLQKSADGAPPQIFLQMLGGALLTQALHAAAVLDLAGLVKEGPRSLAELATEAQVAPRALARLLRALVSAGVFAEVEPEVYGQSELSRLLCQDVPNSMYSLALMYGDEWQWRPWEAFLYSLRTEKPAFDHLYGMSLWQYFQQHNPRSGQIFDAGMSNLASQVNLAIAAAYDFSQFTTLVDVGGGEGSLLRAILRKQSGLKGILFDQPSVLERAREQFAREDLLERCTFVPGTFLEAVAVEADAYLIKHILKGWDDSGAIAILRNCREVIKPGGKLLVVEHLFAGPGMLFEKLVDLQLLLVATGGERSEEEYRQLFAAAGFALEVFPTTTPNVILAGTPV